MYSSTIPQQYHCALSSKLMNIPVILRETGDIYECTVLNDALRKHPNIDPLTGESIRDMTIEFHFNLQKEIEEYSLNIAKCTPVPPPMTYAMEMMSSDSDDDVSVLENKSGSEGIVASSATQNCFLPQLSNHLKKSCSPPPGIESITPGEFFTQKFYTQPSNEHILIHNHRKHCEAHIEEVLADDVTPERDPAVAVYNTEHHSGSSDNRLEVFSEQSESLLHNSCVEAHIGEVLAEDVTSEHDPAVAVYNTEHHSDSSDNRLEVFSEQSESLLHNSCVEAHIEGVLAEDMTPEHDPAVAVYNTEHHSGSSDNRLEVFSEQSESLLHNSCVEAHIGEVLAEDVTPEHDPAVAVYNTEHHSGSSDNRLEVFSEQSESLLHNSCVEAHIGEVLAEDVTSEHDPAVAVYNTEHHSGSSDNRLEVFSEQSESVLHNSCVEAHIGEVLAEDVTSEHDPAVAVYNTEHHSGSSDNRLEVFSEQSESLLHNSCVEAHIEEVLAEDVTSEHDPALSSSDEYSMQLASHAYPVDHILDASIGNSKSNVLLDLVDNISHWHFHGGVPDSTAPVMRLPRSSLHSPTVVCGTKEYAETFGYESCCRAVAELAASVLTPELEDTRPRRDGGNTALHAAAQNGHLDIVDVLVKSGSHLDVRNGVNCTALALACRYGRLEVVKLLLSCGANVRTVRKSDICQCANTDDSDLKKQISAAINSYRRANGMSYLR